MVLPVNSYFRGEHGANTASSEIPWCTHTHTHTVTWAYTHENSPLTLKHRAQLSIATCAQVQYTTVFFMEMIPAGPSIINQKYSQSYLYLTCQPVMHPMLGNESQCSVYGRSEWFLWYKKRLKLGYILSGLTSAGAMSCTCQKPHQTGKQNESFIR